MVFNAVKNVARNYLPVQLKDALIKTCNQKKLSAVKKLDLNSSRLCPISKISLDKILSSEAAGEYFREDHARIAHIFSNDDLMGGVNPGDRRALYHLIFELRPENILETGTHIGASTLHIAAAAKRICEDSKNKTRIHTVDIYDVNADNGAWKNSGLGKTPRRLLKDTGLDSFVTFHDQGSIAFLQNTTDKFDFIFLDGDHAADTVYREISETLPRLNENGIILLHDYYPHAKALFKDGRKISGPYLAGERIMRENPDIAILPLGKLPWQTKQGSHMTSLALVLRKD